MDYNRLSEILNRIKGLLIAVVGDYCLDEYLTIDPDKNEPSLETGLVAYQVVKREVTPGAAGTVAKNLAILGVRNVISVGYVGDDGRGLELTRGLNRFGVDTSKLIISQDRITPAYVKPWIMSGGTVREMNRLDIKNWTETPPDLADKIIINIDDVLGKVDAMIVLDQIIEENCGVITDHVLEAICKIAQNSPDKTIYADSRGIVAKFRGMIIKGNQFEVIRSVTGGDVSMADPELTEQCAAQLMRQNGKPVVVTMGDKGALICADDEFIRIPAVEVSGEIDVCGAGDAFTSAFVSAYAAGADINEAGIIGNLSASVCISQLGSTGIITDDTLLRHYKYPRVIAC